jgi:hypothetical protein
MLIDKTYMQSNINGNNRKAELIKKEAYKLGVIGNIIERT